MSIKLNIKTFTANNFCGIPDHEGVTSFYFCHNKKDIFAREPIKDKWFKTKRETVSFNFQYKGQYVTVEIEPITTGLGELPAFHLDITLACACNTCDQYRTFDRIDMLDSGKMGLLILKSVDQALKLSHRLPRKEPLVYGN